jgi:hypothetical protein
VLQRLDDRLKSASEPVDVNVKADRNLPYEVVKKLVVALELRRGRGLVRRAYAGVSERQNP